MIRFVSIALVVLLAMAASACGGGSSAQSSQPPPPPAGLSISSLSPSSAPADGPDLMLTITGTGFDGAGVIQSRVTWTSGGNETVLARTVTSSTQIAASIPAALLQSPVTAQIAVEEFDRIEGTVNAQSNSLRFTVTSTGNGVPSISPSTETLGPQGTRQFVFTIAGNNTNAVWTVEEGASGGTITSAGLYSAPSSVGTFHIIATSVADSTQTAVASVSVTNSGFTQTGNMHVARAGHTASLLANGKILVAGPDSSAELYDPASGTFSAAASMSTSRFGATATLLQDGKVLIVGGFGPGTGELPRLASAEIYDPLTDTFTVSGSMTVGRVLHTATLLGDGKVLVAGGTDGSGGGGAATATAELFDPSTGTFTLPGSMNTDRAQHTATLLTTGELLIAGGWNGHAADAPDDPPWDPLLTELFNPASGAFKSSVSMTTTRIGHHAIRLDDGRVLIFGGVPNLQNLHDQPSHPDYAELYDPQAREFSSLTGFDLSKTGYSATLLADGTVLIAGGDEARIAVTSAALLDPKTGSLTPTGGLVTPREGHTATLLSDGRVLVIGGTDVNGNALASAEVYK